MKTNAMAEVVVQHVLCLEIKMEKDKKQHAKRNWNDVKITKHICWSLAFFLLIVFFFYHSLRKKNY